MALSSGVYRLLKCALISVTWLCFLLQSSVATLSTGEQRVLSTAYDRATSLPKEDQPATPVSPALFRKLEEASRLVGIAYCVGYSGIQEPFTCLNRCADFEGFELVKTWQTGLLGVIGINSCGYVALSHPPARKRIVVAFRGTNSLANVMTDFMGYPHEYTSFEPPGGEDPKCNNCSAHAGFMASWDATKSEIMEELQELRKKYPDYQISLMGHSLGGAVAGLAALELQSLPWAGDVDVVTFGEPMFGNENLANYTDLVFAAPKKPLSSENDGESAGPEYYRVTHVGDPVPEMPPREFGWRQHSHEVFIAKASLPPEISDVLVCHGRDDPACLAASSSSMPTLFRIARRGMAYLTSFLPSRWKLWNLFFAHREYFWRLGLCYDPQWRSYD